jgi:homoserine dehydrogenase
MAMKLKLALLGFGNVGRGLARLLIDKHKLLKETYRVEFSVIGVYDLRLGGVLQPDSGIDLERLLEIVEADGLIADYPGASEDLNSLGLIEMSGADVLVEMTNTDLETGQPALSHCEQSLANGIHVVTSNKGPAAFAKSELWKLAEDNGVHFRFEGAVMSGTPVISLVTSSLAGAEITGFRGILNGSCNHILTRMEDAVSYETALREAQDMGYTEANPDIDVDGWDATAKGVILANTLMDADLTLKDIPREGITKISESEIDNAKAENRRWRLLVECEKVNGDVTLTVAPQKLELSDPLSNVMGTKNALTISTDVMGDITIYGRGAGRQETGFAILSDLLWIHRRITGKAY